MPSRDRRLRHGGPRRASRGRHGAARGDARRPLPPDQPVAVPDRRSSPTWRHACAGSSSSSCPPGRWSRTSAWRSRADARSPSTAEPAGWSRAPGEVVERFGCWPCEFDEPRCRDDRRDPSATARIYRPSGAADRSSRPTTAPAAGTGSSHRLVAEVLEEMGVGPRTIGVASVGCSRLRLRLPRHRLGRGAARPRAGRRDRRSDGSAPDSFVFAYQGDGDLAAIGTAEIIHAAARGERITRDLRCRYFREPIDDVSRPRIPLSIEIPIDFGNVCL